MATKVRLATSVRHPVADEVALGTDDLRHTNFAVYGIVGESVSSSLAPSVVNTALRSLGLSAVYLPFRSHDFDGFWREAMRARSQLGLPLDSLTVVRPHKEAALRVADIATEGATRSGAANLLLRKGTGWLAANTSGVVDPLAEAGVPASGLRAAVIGCGGAGRSIAAELTRCEADVTLVNRGVERGRFASGLLRLPWKSLHEFSPAGFDLIVNATPLGDSPPFELAGLEEGVAVADLVYLPDRMTALVAAARERGLCVIDGRRILIAELGRQFRLMTGLPLPPDAIAAAMGDGPSE